MFVDRDGIPYRPAQQSPEFFQLELRQRIDADDIVLGRKLNETQFRVVGIGAREFGIDCDIFHFWFATSN